MSQDEGVAVCSPLLLQLLIQIIDGSTTRDQLLENAHMPEKLWLRYCSSGWDLRSPPSDVNVSRQRFLGLVVGVHGDLKGFPGAMRYVKMRMDGRGSGSGKGRRRRRRKGEARNLHPKL